MKKVNYKDLAETYEVLIDNKNLELEAKELIIEGLIMNTKANVKQIVKHKESIDKLILENLILYGIVTLTLITVIIAVWMN